MSKFINIYDTKNYKNFIPLAGYKNKPNSNPIKPNCQKGKIDAKYVFTKDYRKKDDFLVRINKPNFQKSQMNLNILSKRAYENFIPLAGQKNKPNSNPIKPNCRKAKMVVNLYFTKDYRKKDDFSVRINKPNFVKGPK